MEFEEIIESVPKLSTQQLEEIRSVIDKEISGKRLLEIEAALKDAKEAIAGNKLKFYSSGEDILSALNED